MLLLAAQALFSCSRQEGRISENPDPISVKRSSENTSVRQSHCRATEEKSPDGALPVLKQSCRLGRFSCIRRGIPDEKGRYIYHSEWFVDSAGKQFPVPAEAIFNHHKQELLSRINEKIKLSVQEQMSEGEQVACFKGFSFQPYSFSQMEISLTGSGIDFELAFGFSEECLAADGLIISFSFEELKDILRI